MAPQMFKGLIILFLKNPPQLHRFPNSYSISLFFSSSVSSKRTSSKPSIQMSDYLVKQHNFSPEAAMKASSTIKNVRNPKRSDYVLSFLKECGLSKAHIEQIVARRPKILSANLDVTIRPKIKLLQDLGCTPADMADIISKGRWILDRSADNLVGPSIMVLKNVLGSNAAVCKVLKYSGCYFRNDLKKTMEPSIEYLKSIGISSKHINKFILHFPRFFTNKPESIQEFVRRADEMGFDRQSKMLIYAIRVLSSMSLERWHLKLKLLQSLGFSENDILAVFRRMPMVFSVSEEKIKKTTELLLSEGKSDISYIVQNPQLLALSIEKRLKPRLQVIDALEKNMLIQRRPSLCTLCTISHQKFLEGFVFPHSDMLSEELKVSLLGGSKGSDKIGV